MRDPLGRLIAVGPQARDYETKEYSAGLNEDMLRNDLLTKTTKVPSLIFLLFLLSSDVEIRDTGGHLSRSSNQSEPSI